MALLLENMAFDTGSAHQVKTRRDPTDCYEFEPSSSAAAQNSSALQNEILEALSSLYCSLKEEDLWAGLWQKRAKYPETNVGIAFELQGFYDKAQGAYEQAMTKAQNDCQGHPAPFTVFSEFKILEEHWMKYVSKSAHNIRTCNKLKFYFLLFVLKMREGTQSLGDGSGIWIA